MPSSGVNICVLGICKFSEILGRNVNICHGPTPNGPLVSIISISKSLLLGHIASMYFNCIRSEIHNCADRPEIHVKLFAHKNVQFLQIQQFVSKDALQEKLRGS
jgi:hypothetical protein